MRSGARMGRHSVTRSETILSKLRRLPAVKQAAVLDFVEYLAFQKRRTKSLPSIYGYSARLVKQKRLRKLSLRKIAAIIHDVRHVKD